MKQGGDWGAFLRSPARFRLALNAPYAGGAPETVCVSRWAGGRAGPALLSPNASALVAEGLCRGAVGEAGAVPRKVGVGVKASPGVAAI